MRIRMTQLMTLVAGIALLPLWSSAESGRTEYVLGGSGTNVPLTRLLVGEFGKSHPEHALKLLSSISSAGGIKAVHKGKIPLGLAGRPLKAMELTWDLTYLPCAKTPLVFGANSSVPDENVSTADVLAVYAGKKTKWKDGSTIVVVLREEGDNGAAILTQALDGFKPILENAWRSGIWRVEYKDDDCNKTLARIKGAFGWTDLGMLSISGYKIKKLNFNGMAPSVENLVSGKYRLYKELAFVYKEPLPEPLKQFLKFVRSPEGAALIRRNGYVAIP